MEEIYKDIKDLEGLYQVSNFGNILSLNYYRSGKPKLLKPSKTKNGYLLVTLYKNRKRKSYKVHQLVAEHFIPNTDNLPEINHIDEDKTNNRVDNLEWKSHKGNCNHGTRNERIVKANTNGKRSKIVLQFTLSGEFIREWKSAHDCGRNGFNQGNIISCCNGKLKSHKGFIWRYKKEVV